MSEIWIADDHPLFRSALAHVIGRLRPDLTIRETDCLSDIETWLSRDPKSVVGQGPVLLLLDLKLSDAEGFSGLVSLRTHFPQVPVVVVSASEDRGTIERALAFGAMGFLPKSASMETLAEGLEALFLGDVWSPLAEAGQMDGASDQIPEADMAGRIASLTPAQLRILLDLKKGRLNKQIAYEMNVTEATVKAHMTVIFRKLGVLNRTQAVIAAQSLDLPG